MEILQVFNSRIQKHGSFEDFMIELAKASKEKNIKLAFVFPDIKENKVREELESFGAQTHIIKSSWSSLNFIIELLRIVKKENPSILDFHFCASLNFTFLFLILRILGKKVIFHYHGEIRPIEELSFVYRYFSRLALLTLFANKIICVSEANKKFLEAHNIKKEIVVIYNGISIDNFKVMSSSGAFKKEMGFNNGELIITSIGSLIPRKGIDILIKAAKNVLESVPQARFIIVGGGEKNEYQKLAENLGIKDKIIFTGLMREYPFDILNSTDLYVSASYSESFGLSIAEAQLLGIPVVATKVGGVPEVVEDGVTGLLVPPWDAESLGKSIIKLLKDVKLRKKMSLAGPEMVSEKFDLKQRVEELISHVS